MCAERRGGACHHGAIRFGGSTGAAAAPGERRHDPGRRRRSGGTAAAAPADDVTIHAVAGDPAPPPAEVPHLPSPENLPPGTTNVPSTRRRAVGCPIYATFGTRSDAGSERGRCAAAAHAAPAGSARGTAAGGAGRPSATSAARAAATPARAAAAPARAAANAVALRLCSRRTRVRFGQEHACATACPHRRRASRWTSGCSGRHRESGHGHRRR